MLQRIVLGFITALPLVACASDDPAGASCAEEGLSLSGAVTRSTRSASVITVGCAIIGIGGIDVSTQKSYSFVTRDVLHTNLNRVGTHDVSVEQVKFLEAESGDDCTEPDQCTGFVAQAGTVEVASLDPFSATFTLSALVESNDSTSTLGPAMSGTVTGCMFAPE